MPRFKNVERKLPFLLLLLSLSCAAQDRNPPRETNSGFPEIYNSETEPGQLTSPDLALESLQLPDGFSATLFSAEPDVQNPIAMCFDARGRVWVAENYTYAERSQRFDLNLHDRIVVLEDANGDGRADKRTVFSDSVQMLTGITVGQGGVWIMCPPQLMFIPDSDGDLVPDGPPEVKLDGFHVARENYHNFANGLSWGPDGWLYGRCGASCAGEMGLPGSSEEERVPIRGGIWRYHPQRQVVEALTHGTTNPWGHDWNSVGELFFINTVNGHLWHAIPGAHFMRAHTLDANPHIYELIDMHADHWHFDTGQSWTKSRGGAANDYGGGHAHVGMMIYQGDTWPERYRGKLMTINMHGRRVNVEQLEREGSGYVARHDDDFLLSDDEWFRGMDIVTGPDGNALLIDWSDIGECHDHTGVHRRSGRIFKISSGQSRASLLTAADGALGPNELAQLQETGSEWDARRGRELLRSLKLSGRLTAEAEQQLAQRLQKQLQSANSSPQRLRALWSLVAIDAVSYQQLLELLSDRDETVRSWAVRLLADDWRIDNSDGSRPAESPAPATDQEVARLVDLAAGESAASVRLALASVLQRLPHARRPALAKALFSHSEDADDHNLPLMVWYGLTPLGDDELAELAELAGVCDWPVTRRLLARRVADQIDSHPKVANRLVDIAISKDQAFGTDLVLGWGDALAGRRRVVKPARWSALRDRLASVDQADLQLALQKLNVLFGDGVAISELKRIAADETEPLDVRKSALQSLVDARAEGMRELCLKLLRKRFLNTVAAAGLAQETGPEIGQQLVKAYYSFGPLDRSQVISILSSRKAWATALLTAVSQGQIDREAISPFQARQIASLGDTALDALLAKTWGQVRESPAERREQIAKLRAELTPEVLAGADKRAGRAVFEKSCSNCHKLYGQGGELGPDLTGAQRSNLNYLLENIVDPSAVVNKEFRATVILMEDGRVLTGLMTSRTDHVVTLATQNETVRLAVDEIQEAKLSTASTMPDGLLSQLSGEQIRDLFAYLQSKQQLER